MDAHCPFLCLNPEEGAGDVPGEGAAEPPAIPGVMARGHLKVITSSPASTTRSQGGNGSSCLELSRLWNMLSHP